MSVTFNPGDLLFLTEAYDVYLKSNHPRLKIKMVNRLAKLEEIIDWASPKGKLIKDLREKSGKWGNLSIEDNKYILSIYYHDLKGKKGEEGSIERGVPMFLCHPKTGADFFTKVPDWIRAEIDKPCEEFDALLRDPK